MKVNVLIEKKEIDASKASEYKEGVIIGQSVEAGGKLSEGDTITLYVPKLDNKYPDFVSDGATEEEVRAFAEQYGVNVTVNYQVSSDVPEGTVISQSRAAGSTVVSGARLTIVVAKAGEEASDVDPDSGDLE